MTTLNFESQAAGTLPSLRIALTTLLHLRHPNAY